MLDRTDHNLAEQFAQRFAAPEPVIPLPSRPMTAAKVATEGTYVMSSPSLFAPAENTSAFLKSGFMGFQGSGKTKTASLLTIGLVLHMRKLGIDGADKKPVFFLDTETGSDWVKPDFDEMGVPLFVSKTRAFADLVGAIEEAKKHASALLIDSASHFWKELCDSYRRAKMKHLKTTSYRLQFQDWAQLKGEQGWQQFTDSFVNSPLHMIVAGRAGYEYDYFEDDDGKKQLEKTGVKMKAEGEFGYEPSLLVQMEMKQRIEGKAVDDVWREAHIIKDRSTLIDGKTFSFRTHDDDGARHSTEQLVRSTFAAFYPHIKRLNLGGKQLGVDVSRTSEHMIPAERKDWSSTQRKVVVAEIEALLFDAHPGQTKEDKIGRAALVRKHFADDEMTWTRIEEMVGLDDLKHAYDSMHRDVKGSPSRYGSAIIKDAASLDLNDSLPDHSRAIIQPTAELLASRLVVEATKPAVDTADVSADGIPTFLDRRSQTVTAEAPAFDEAKWLADLTKAFDECVDFVTFGQKQQVLMTPAKPQVTAPTWKKASRLAKRAIERLTEQSTGDFAIAAE